MLCHPQATLEFLARPMRPPVAALPIRKGMPHAASARDVGPSYNLERISAAKRFHGLDDGWFLRSA